LLWFWLAISRLPHAGKVHHLPLQYLPFSSTASRGRLDLL
jgi:hypothetical protein